MLLEAAHKFCEDSVNPELRQDVVSGDLLGKRSGNATEKAEEWHTRSVSMLDGMI